MPVESMYPLWYLTAEEEEKEDRTLLGKQQQEPYLTDHNPNLNKTSNAFTSSDILQN